MSKGPVLRQGFFHQREVRAVGGLHMIKHNGKPYFSLVMESWQHMPSGRRVEDVFGAAHDELVRYWPELAPLAALHLSDVDGVPMHAEANGWYWLAGAAGGLQQQYHGGNSFPARSPDECLAIFAKHVRLPIDQAREVIDCIKFFFEERGAKEARKEFALWVESQKPRWKREAEACIEQLSLSVFGDQYPYNIRSANNIAAG